MGSALMAWVCIGLTLAQLNNAESHRDAHGHLAGQDELFQQLFFAAPEDSDRSFRAPVWNFLHVEDPLLTSSTHLYHHERKMSDINQPQYRCSNGTLFLRFSLIRYSNLRLEDGVQLLSLPDRCHSSISIYRWWLLVKLPTGCYTAIRPGDGTGYHPVKLHYFDHLLQEAMTGMAVCENPVVLPQAAPPLVTCRTTHVTVKLPHGTKLRKVKELDFFTHEGFSVIQRKTPNALFVQISKLSDTDSGFELVYVDSTGKLCTMLAVCDQKKVRHRVGRALEEPDLFDLWDFEEVPVEPFDPDTTQATDSSETDTLEESDDAGFYLLWGFEEIPEDPYTGIDTEITEPTAPTTITTAAPTTTAAPDTTTVTTPVPVTTAAPSTTITTAAPATTTTAAPATTMVPTAAPSTSTSVVSTTTTSAPSSTTATSVASTTTTSAPSSTTATSVASSTTPSAPSSTTLTSAPSSTTTSMAFTTTTSPPPSTTSNTPSTTSAGSTTTSVASTTTTTNTPSTTPTTTTPASTTTTPASTTTTPAPTTTTTPAPTTTTTPTPP